MILGSLNPFRSEERKLWYAFNSIGFHQPYKLMIPSKFSTISLVRRFQALILAGATALIPCTVIAADNDSSPKRHSISEFSKDGRDKMDWRVVVDGVMGGLSTGNMALTSEGTARFDGTLSLENNGGFSSIRTARIEPLDLSEMSAIRLRVKGDGRTYQFRLESDARYRGSWAVSFKADFATKKGEWIEVEIPFSEFKGGWRGRDLPEAKLNPATIERFGVILGDKKPGPFAIEVDWIHAVGK